MRGSKKEGGAEAGSPGRWSGDLKRAPGTPEALEAGALERRGERPRASTTRKASGERRMERVDGAPPRAGFATGNGFNGGREGSDGLLVARGAEAELRIVMWMGRRALAKRRVPKSYRLPELDLSLRELRTRVEARLLREARLAGVPTPLVYDIDLGEGACTLTMEYIEGEVVKRLLNRAPLPLARRICGRIGRAVGALHSGGIIHGDLTTSNMLLSGGKMYFIDFGLGAQSDELEARGVDLRVLREAFSSTHARIEHLFKEILRGYAERFAGSGEAVARMEEIASRGRYAD